MTPQTRRGASSLRPVIRASEKAFERDNTASVPIPSHTTPHRISAIITRSDAKRTRSSDSLFGALRPANASVLRKASSKRVRTHGALVQLALPEVMLASPRTASTQLPTFPSTLTENKLPAPTQGSVALSSPDSGQFVRSSQSDEVELIMPLSNSYDLHEVKRNVQKWREEAFNSSAFSEAMEAEPPGSADISFHSYHRRSRTASTAIPGNFVQPSACLPSPDTTEISLPPLPPTPKPLDGDAKATKLISEIKARAFATVNVMSDEERPLLYRELDDSDDGLDLASSMFSGTKNGRHAIPSLTSILSPADGPSSRLRSRHVVTQSPSSRPSRTSGRAHQLVPARSPIQATARTSSCDVPLRRSKKALNPLDALLREKRAAHERGTSSAALHLAEISVTRGSLGTFTDSRHDGSDASLSSLGFLNEEAAWRAIQDGLNARCSTPSKDRIVTKDVVLGVRDTRLSGSAFREAADKILVGDKADSGIEEAEAAKREKAVGITLWQVCSDNDMIVDATSTSAEALFGDDSPMLSLITRLYRNGDDAPLVLLLESGVLIDVPPDRLHPLVTSLFTNGIFASARLADAFRNALRDLCASGRNPITLPFSCVTISLIQLGASLSVFEKLGWLVDVSVHSKRLSNDVRCEVLLRLVAAVRIVACAAGFASNEVADIVLSMVIVGLDVSSSHDLRTQLNFVIDAICTYNVKDLATHSSIHQKVLGFASDLNPANEARLVSFFSSGGERTRHIAQWLAYSLLLSTTVSPTDQLPSLAPLIQLLSPLPDSGELFDVASNKTDYQDLEHYVSILAVALANITQYVREEHFLAQQASITSVEGCPTKAKQPHPPLECLRNALEVIQGKIVDTRAAHLDRSRTKASIQRLTMRVYYERLAIKGGSSHGRASTLQDWLSPRN